MKNAYDYVINLILASAIAVVIVLIWNAPSHAFAPESFYHGIDGFHSSTALGSSSNDNSINLKSFGAHPFIGARFNQYLSLQAGYIHHRSSSEFGAMSTTLAYYPAVPGKPRSSFMGNARHTATYTIHGPTVGLVLHTPMIQNLPIRFFASASVFLSGIRITMERTFPEMNFSAAENIPAISKSQVFAHLSAGLMYYVSPTISLRPSLSILRPQRLDLSQFQHVVIRELRHFTHIGLGIHWEWK